MDRHDPVAAIGRRTERLSQIRDLDGEVAFLHRLAAPRGVHQFRLGEDVARAAEQRFEQLRRPVAQSGKDDPVPPDSLRPGVELEGSATQSRVHAGSLEVLWNN